LLLFLRLHSSPCHTLPALFFFFNDTAPTEIYTLSLHDALPILAAAVRAGHGIAVVGRLVRPLGGPVLVAHVVRGRDVLAAVGARSEEHTSELQSLTNLVCRLLLEKKNNTTRAAHVHQ